MPIEYKFEPSEMDLTNGEMCHVWGGNFADPKYQILYQFVRHVKVHPIYHFESGEHHPLDSSFLVRSPAEMYRAIYDFEAYFEDLPLGYYTEGFHIDEESGSDNGFFPLQEEDKERAKWMSEDVPLFKGFFVEVALNHKMDYLEAAMPELNGIHWTCSHEIKQSEATVYIKQFQIYDWTTSIEAMVNVLQGIYCCMMNELQ
jgi:hypothetical protein